MATSKVKGIKTKTVTQNTGTGGRITPSLSNDVIILSAEPNVFAYAIPIILNDGDWRIAIMGSDFAPMRNTDVTVVIRYI